MVLNEHREALRRAHEARDKAEKRFEDARSATERARSVLTTVIEQAEKADAAQRQAIADRAEKLCAAIVDGREPSFAAVKSPPGDDFASRRAVVERIVSDLAGVEREASMLREDARAEVAECARTVLRSEAAEIAETWSEADERARALRVRLGEHYGPIGRLGRAGATVARAIDLNSADPVNVREIQEVNAAWTDFAAGLASDADARLQFGSADDCPARLDFAHDVAEWAQ
jgi:hypothetical protein